MEVKQGLKAQEADKSVLRFKKVKTNGYENTIDIDIEKECFLNGSWSMGHR